MHLRYLLDNCNHLVIILLLLIGLLLCQIHHTSYLYLHIITHLLRVASEILPSPTRSIKTSTSNWLVFKILRNNQEKYCSCKFLFYKTWTLPKTFVFENIAVESDVSYQHWLIDDLLNRLAQKKIVPNLSRFFVMLFMNCIIEIR